jgi:hypothetical protein
MLPSGMLRHVALVKTDVSEERIASIIRVTISGNVGTKLAATSNRQTLQKIHRILVTLKMEALHSSKMSDLTRATYCNIPEDSILACFIVLR